MLMTKMKFVLCVRDANDAFTGHWSVNLGAMSLSNNLFVPPFHNITQLHTKKMMAQDHNCCVIPPQP